MATLPRHTGITPHSTHANFASHKFWQVNDWIVLSPKTLPIRYCSSQWPMGLALVGWVLFLCLQTAPALTILSCHRSFLIEPFCATSSCIHLFTLCACSIPINSTQACISQCEVTAPAVVKLGRPSAWMCRYRRFPSFDRRALAWARGLPPKTPRVSSDYVPGVASVPLRLGYTTNRGNRKI